MRRTPILLLSVLLLVDCAAAFAQSGEYGDPRAPRERLSEDKLRMRDPFKHPARVIEKMIVKTELEKVGLEQIRIIGITTGPGAPRAMISAGAKTYIVKENMKMGLRSGVVRRITAEAIIVREKIVNAIGEEESLDTPIKFTEQSKVGTTGPSTGATPGPAPVPANNASTQLIRPASQPPMPRSGQ